MIIKSWPRSRLHKIYVNVTSAKHFAIYKKYCNNN